MRFKAAAVQAGRTSLALAAQLAWDIGPRAGDVRSLTGSQYDGEAFTLVQRKTGQPVREPLSFEETRRMLDERPVRPSRWW